jgi:glycosyltransferase involved in cell wall biosynthesis
MSRLGHVVVPLKAKRPGARLGSDADIRSSLWENTKHNLRSLPLYKVFLKGVRIFQYSWREGFVFLSAFVVIVRHQGKLDVIYRRHSVFNSEFLLSKLFNIPLVKEVNGIMADEARMQNVGGSLIQRVIDTIERFNMPKADRIIVVTAKLKDVLRDNYHVPEEKIAVILNGANTDLFKPMEPLEARNKLGLNQSDNYVCFVGNLIQWQGVEYLIESAPLVLSSCPNTRFLIVGDGVMKEELAALAKQTGVSDRLIFTGYVPYELVPEYINSGDICIAPFIAERNERIGSSALKLCEYLACAKPVVASRISGLEFIESNQAGILVVPEIIRELGNAIIKLLKAPDLRKKMGENGRRYVVEERSWESVARKVAVVCQQAVEEHKQRSEKRKTGKL